MLLPLADNGGATQTHALPVGSPAVDAYNCTGVDQRGVARPQGASCDIGSFELTVGAPITVTPSNTPTSTVTFTPSVINTFTPVFTFTLTDTLTPTCSPGVTAPTLISPVDQAHTTDTTPTFTWSAVNGAQSYRLNVHSPDNSFVYQKRVFTTDYTLTEAEALAIGTYLWQVQTQDLFCSTWSDFSSPNTLFIDLNTQTLTPSHTACAISVTAPSLNAPAHRAHTTDRTPTFTWSQITGAQSYRLMIYTEDRSFEFKKRRVGQTSTSYTLTSAEALVPTKYLWRVRTQDTICSTWTSWSQRNTLFVD